MRLSDLREETLIGYEATSPFGKLIARLYDGEGEPMEPSIEVGSPQNACALVRAGAGIAITDRLSAMGASHDGGIVFTALSDAPTLDAHILRRAGEDLSPIAEAFVQVLRSLVVHDDASTDAGHRTLVEARSDRRERLQEIQA